MNVLEDSPALIALCEEFNLASINRGPLAMGLLTGKFSAGAALPTDDVRGRHSPEWMRYFKNGQPNSAWLKKLEAVRDILTSEGRTASSGSVGLAWAKSSGRYRFRFQNHRPGRRKLSCLAPRAADGGTNA